MEQQLQQLERPAATPSARRHEVEPLTPAALGSSAATTTATTPYGLSTAAGGVTMRQPEGFLSVSATPVGQPIVPRSSVTDMEGIETAGGRGGSAAGVTSSSISMAVSDGGEDNNPSAAAAAGTVRGLAAGGSAGDGGSTAKPGWGLGNNTDVVTCRAEWLLHRGAHEACYALTSSLLERDPCALQAMPTHLAAALHLGKKGDLFLRGHNLVDSYPQLALSWFAVGCYYTCIGNHEAARRYFGKATTLDSSFAPAWVAFGHAFAAQDERDQAMAAYRSAARLFPGLHAPVLGMGMEYMALGNLSLAAHMLQAAQRLCPQDPRPCHELGVLSFREGQYGVAEAWLERALAVMAAGTADGGGGGGVASLAWEPTLVALGHVYRKQQRYDRSLQLLQRALGLNPGCASTHAAVAYTLQLMGDAAGAIDSYHRCLALKPEDPFALEMLAVALEDFAADLAVGALPAAEEPGVM